MNLDCKGEPKIAVAQSVTAFAAGLLEACGGLQALCTDAIQGWCPVSLQVWLRISLTTRLFPYCFHEFGKWFSIVWHIEFILWSFYRWTPLLWNPLLSHSWSMAIVAFKAKGILCLHPSCQIHHRMLRTDACTLIILLWFLQTLWTAREGHSIDHHWWPQRLDCWVTGRQAGSVHLQADRVRCSGDHRLNWQDQGPHLTHWRSCQEGELSIATTSLVSSLIRSHLDNSSFKRVNVLPNYQCRNNVQHVSDTEELASCTPEATWLNSSKSIMPWVCLLQRTCRTLLSGPSFFCII